MNKTEFEEWRTITDYPEYMVSNLGNVKSLNYNRTGKEKILKQAINNYGYCCVTLCKEGKIKYYTTHRLVANAFLDNPNNYPCINHKDENKQNNCASNLEYCTADYNNNYGTHNEKISKALKGKPKLHLQKSILQLSKEGLFIKEFSSITQANNELNINCGHIGSCCRGERKTCGGYKWMYLEDYLNNIKKVS